MRYALILQDPNSDYALFFYCQEEKGFQVSVQSQCHLRKFSSSNSKVWTSQTHDLQITHMELKALRKTLFFTVQILQISNRNHGFTTNVLIKLCSGDPHLTLEYFLSFFDTKNKIQ